MNCWFCTDKQADDACGVRLYMYGEIEAADTEENKKRIAYSTKSIVVPRCADCKKRHATAKRNGVLAILAAALMAAAAAAAFILPAAGWFWWLTGVLLGLGAGLAALFLALRSMAVKGIIRLPEAKREYPELKDLLQRGYKFGKSPTYEESIQANGALTEVDKD